MADLFKSIAEEYSQVRNIISDNMQDISKDNFDLSIVMVRSNFLRITSEEKIATWLSQMDIIIISCERVLEQIKSDEVCGLL
jgi:hypothetical protein